MWIENHVGFTKQGESNKIHLILHCSRCRIQCFGGLILKAKHIMLCCFSFQDAILFFNVKCSTECHRRPFLPVAIKLHNSYPICKKEGGREQS